MPVPAQVGGLVRHDDHVEGSGGDGQLASRAQVLLAGLVGLDGGDGHPEKIAHPITSKVAATASTTITMSAALRSCSRKGLNPTPRR